MAIRDTEPDIFHLEVDETAKAHLLEMARWARFLSIVGFIFMGLLVVICVFLAIAMSSVSALQGVSGLYGLPFAVLMVIYAAIIILYFYPVFALYKFSSNIKPAVSTANKEEFNRALKYLKGMFKYLGIITIISIVIYGLGIIFAIIGLAAR